MVYDSDTGLPWWIAALAAFGICVLVIGSSLAVQYLVLEPVVYLPYPGN